MNLTLNNIKIRLYYIEQNIYELVAYELKNANMLIFILIFISGIITSINPCTLSLLPITTSYIHSSKNKHYKKNMFIVGMISSFVVIIGFTSLFNTYFKYLTSSVPTISSCYMIFLGFNILKIIEFNFQHNNNKVKANYLTIRSIIKDYTTGFLVGLNSSSCSTPILATLIFSISQSKLTLLSLMYILCYSLGYTFPIIILLNQATNYTYSLNIQKVWKYIISVSGSIILGLGNLSLLSNLFI